MGLAKRVIPCLDVTAGRVVKGVKFVELRDAGDPVEIAARYDGEGADELTFLDITASSDDRDILLHVIEAVASKVFIPLTVGGGVRQVDDVRRLLNAGADKVSINTAAVHEPRPGARGLRHRRHPVHRRRHRRQEEGRRRGRSSPTAAARPPASTPCSGRSACSRPAPARSCSPAWTATARATASTSRLTRAVSEAVGIPVDRLRRRRLEGAPRRRRPRRPRRRGARRQRVPLRRLHRAPGEGVHAEPRHRGAACELARRSALERARPGGGRDAGRSRPDESSRSPG